MESALKNQPPDVSEVLKRITTVRHTLASYGVRTLGVFGSVARGNARPDSDIDVIVDLDPRHETLDDLIAVAELLEATLETHVDLVTRNGVSRYVAPNIESEAQYVRIS
jgi:uncharacterized protein